MESNQIDKTCPYCQSPIDQSDQTTVCSHCMIPHHAECWLENGGCTTYGCKYAPVLAPASPTGVAGSSSRTIAPAGLSGGVICPYCQQATSNSLQKCEHCQGPLYAGFWNRLWALVFDKIVLCSLSYFGLFIFITLGLITANVAGGGDNSDVFIGIAFIVYLILMLVASWLYYAIFESSSRCATLGKILLGIAVTDYEGRRITFGRASARYFASILSYLLLFLGYIAAALTPRKQALHDTIAHTVVVRSVRPDSTHGDQNQTRRLVIGIIIGSIMVISGLISVYIIMLVRKLS